MMNKRIIMGCMAALLTVGSFAQSGTNSPYSQYGLGVLDDQSQGFSRGMNGVGLALRRGNVVNTLNPASYSAVDSLTMLFDVGLSGQITSFKEGTTKSNAKSANFEYFASSFRLMRGVGVGFGILPLSNVGYSYSTSTYINRENGSVAEVYSGNGGLHQAFVGLGWQVIRPLSVGFNASYLWGTIDRSVITGATTDIKSLKKVYSASMNNYTLDFGFQWKQPLSRKDFLTIGATVGIGHKLGSDANCDIINIDGNTNKSDTTQMVVENAFQLPMSYGLGVALTHDERLFVGADFSLQKWGSTSFPVYKDNDYVLSSHIMKDRYKVNIGADYVPNPMGRKLINRIHYRFGAGFATPYYIINGKDGPKDVSVSAGFGIPLQNSYNNRSVLNISGQWQRTSASGLITENIFCINIGLTFNERWFMKWKID